MEGAKGGVVVCSVPTVCEVGAEFSPVTNEKKDVEEEAVEGEGLEEIDRPLGELLREDTPEGKWDGE